MSGSAKKLLHAAAGTAASGDPVYVEDVFSNTLYVGNGSGTLNTITTGLDLADKGGAVWIKGRDMGTGNHALYDSERGDASSNHSYKWLVPNEDYQENSGSANLYQLHSLTSTGFKVQYTNTLNEADRNFVSWNFAKQEGFFDVVKYTGDGTSARTVSHNLGCKPGMIMVKRTDSSADWRVWHRYSQLSYSYGVLNSDAAFTNTGGDNAAFYDANGNASNFTLGQGSRVNDTNQNGATYIAYLFAGQGDSDSQIFGDDGDEAIIKCGYYNGNGTTDVTVDVGFEPQWLMIKRSTGNDTGNSQANSWMIFDNMRGYTVTGDNQATLFANSNETEDLNSSRGRLTSTGFIVNDSNVSNSGSTYVYMAIRRGPMKEATAGTDLLDIEAYTGNGNSTREFSLDITPDFIYQRNLGSSYNEPAIHFRVGSAIKTAGAVYTSNLKLDRTKGAHLSTSDDKINQNSESYIMYAFKRFPKAIDILAYDSFDETSLSSFNQPHNLGVKPELMMWAPYYVAQGSTSVNGNFKMWWDLTADNKYSQFSSVDAAASWLDDPTAAHIPLSTNNNQSFYDVPGPNVKGFLVILFASVEGMIKIGEYNHSASGDYTTVSVTTGFQPRFIMLQHDDNGSWTQFDSVQGLSSSNNPHFFWESTNAQTTSVDVFQSISSTGFVVESAGGGNNESFNYGGSGRKTRYIAIA